MALTTGRPSEEAKGPKRRHAGQFRDIVRDLIELGRTDPESWANLGSWHAEKPAANFCRSIVRGTRKDFRPDGAFEAKAEPGTFEVWVRCVEPDEAQDAADERAATEAEAEAAAEAAGTADSDDDD